MVSANSALIWLGACGRGFGGDTPPRNLGDFISSNLLNVYGELVLVGNSTAHGH